MSLENTLLWEKWRPKTIDDIILPKRIKDLFPGGETNSNHIFYGNYGTGKSSLARILIGEYTKDKAYIKLNSSFYTSIDVLRNEVDKFCKTIPMFETKSDLKYVFLDEFDGVSNQYQDAMKAFIEEYNKNVRFIITTNHINKITDGIKSRIKPINFNPQGKEEVRDIKIQIFKRLKEEILLKENIDIEKDDLIEIINKRFPDIRSILVEVQDFNKVKENVLSDSYINDKKKIQLFQKIYEPNLSYDEIFHYINNEFGHERIFEMANILGTSFIKWSIDNNKNVDKLFECNYIISDYSDKIETSPDPLIIGMTIIGKLRDLLI